MLRATFLRAARFGGVCLGLICIAGCAGLGQVMPWDKGVLAKPAMGFEGDRLAGMLGEHVYASREAASGGNGVGGGGCGCN